MTDSKDRRWLIVLGTIIVQMGLGTIYTWSLFNQPLVASFGWELNSVAATFSIMSFALAFATLFSSKIQEKIGLRRLIAFAGITLGAGLIISSQVSSLWALYLFAGIMVGAADGIAYMTVLSNAIKWFPEKKGLISGISIGAYGMGSLVFKYINGFFIESVGVSQAFLFWGLIVMVMLVGGSFLVKEAKIASGVQNVLNKVQKDYSMKEMLRTKESYLLFVVLFTACMSGLFVIGIVANIGVSMAGLDLATAANAVALVAIFNTLGRVILGTLSDRFGRLKVISGALLTTAIAVIVLSTVELNYGIFFACVAAIAFCFGGNITIFPAVVAEFFGLKNQSQNYGVIYQGFGLGALSASFISSILGGFAPTFKLIAVLCIISSVIALILKAPSLKSAGEIPLAPKWQEKRAM
jgi:MFS transporter, OFA family, oxalate/formate antiporter